MDVFNEKEWAKEMRPVLLELVDRATTNLAPAVERAIKKGLDGLDIDVSIKIRQKGPSPPSPTADS